MKQFIIIDLTGVKSIRQCYACYDLAAERIVIYGADRAEMQHVINLLNGPAASPVAIDGKTKSGGVQ